jgi:hypothetical protein
MSDMAQKRDLSDPRTLRDFAKAVKTRKRLDLLTVLTVCDIRGVGPGTWNNWKAMLLRKLYRDTADALEGGLETINRDLREDEAKRALRDLLKGWPEDAIAHEMARHYPPYWQGLPTETQAVFARLLRGLQPDEIRIDLHPDEAATPPARPLRWPTIRASFPALPGRWRCRAPMWWTRAPIRPRTAMPPPSSGCRTPTAPPMKRRACPACAR